jgi:4-hydroxyphenylpyruvate dioxygenase
MQSTPFEWDNPIGIQGFAFLAYGAEQTQDLELLFTKLGMQKTRKHAKRDLFLFEQNKILFLLNAEKTGFAYEFQKSHGPSAYAMGWLVDDAEKAFTLSVERGARPYTGTDSPADVRIPAVYGIGDSLIYFIDQKNEFFKTYQKIQAPQVKDKGLLRIDHLTNNVPVGEMQKWCDFYGKIFNFKEVRYFDIKGLKTGLISKVMVSPGYKVMIPINEPSDKKSQIQEYLDVYKGSGIQHIALDTRDIETSVTSLNEAGIPFLDSPPRSYYDMLKGRLPTLKEEPLALEKLSILADGDKEGYLLQIFTKNQIGPIFYEIIQRENHWGFGDGNFQALFDAIERDQAARGYL